MEGPLLMWPSGFQREISLLDKSGSQAKKFSLAENPVKNTQVVWTGCGIVTIIRALSINWVATFIKDRR